MCDDEMKDLLQDIRDTLGVDTYEPGGYFTIGGGPGTYVVKSPFNTECEFLISSITTSSTTPIGYAVSNSNPSLLAPTHNTTVFGALATGGEGNAYEGVAGFIGAGGDITFIQWQPLGRNGYIYFTNNVASTDSVFCTIAFRRTAIRNIPDVPRQRPLTHTHPMSRRPLRMMNALSKQYSGYESQYPRPYGTNYEHEEIPETQDTSALGAIRKRVGKIGR